MHWNDMQSTVGFNHIMQHTVLHCTVLHCMHSTALRCAKLQYTGQLCTALHCTSLHWTTLHCIALHCTALHCTALYYTAPHCTALHCTALHCTSLDCNLKKIARKIKSVKKGISVFWSYYPHMSRESVSPVCWIFKKNIKKITVALLQRRLTKCFVTIRSNNI